MKSGPFKGANAPFSVILFQRHQKVLLWSKGLIDKMSFEFKSWNNEANTFVCLI